MTETSRPAGAPPPELILWDWNGTLLNDAQYAIDVRNRVFPRFNLPTLESMADYHAQFTFPVNLYYERAGVTDDNFVAVANAWMDEYVSNCETVPLFDDAVTTLAAFAAAGFHQAVLSASQLDTLKRQLACAGILDLFDTVLGLSHIYATSKARIGQDYLTACGVNPQACVMLGDTLHDAEVAQALGCRCVLIARGHQSRQTLLTAGVPVVASLTEASTLLLGRRMADL